MVTRWSEKSAGLKILWIWTLGTAAIMIASVVRPRLNDMEKVLREEDAAAAASALRPPPSAASEHVLEDDEV